MDMEGSSDDHNMRKGPVRSDGKRAVLGDFRCIREDITVEKPFVVNQGKDGATINWDHVESIMHYGYTTCILILGNTVASLR